MSGQVSRGSAGVYQADEQAGVARLHSQVSGRWVGRCRAPCLCPGCWWPPGTLGIPWLAAASFQPLSPSSPRLSLSSPFLSLRRTPVIAFRVTLAQVDLFRKIMYLFIFGYTGPLLLCMDFSLVSGSRGYSLVSVPGLLTAVASPAAERRL